MRSPSLRAVATALVVAAGTTAVAFEWNEQNQCVVFNACNTNPLVLPDACFDEENLDWCDCSRPVLTNSVQGESSGLELGNVWIMGQDGIGNSSVTVSDGTMDLSSLGVGDRIGGTLTNELIPEVAGVPPGSFLFVRGEIRVISTAANSVGFEVVVVESNFFTNVILGYAPTNAAHSNGVLYRGVVTSHGDGNGFTIEYRYEGEPGASPAIEIDDIDSPGFNVRFAISFFGADTDAASVYTVPAIDEIETTTILRRVTEDDIDTEVLPLGSDLCEIVVVENPCKMLEHTIVTRAPGGNAPPIASICLTDSITLEPLEDGTVFIECGEGRAILRGSNSTDGDNGSQGLTYSWDLIVGDPAGIVIPEATRKFMDTEVSVVLPGDYIVQLTVDDGQAENSTAQDEIEIVAEEGFQPDNLPPQISALRADGDDLDLEGATVTRPYEGVPVEIGFDIDADTGFDGCLQELFTLWSKIDGPGDVEFDDPTDDNPRATFSSPGSYTIRASVDDGAPVDNIAAVDVAVEIEATGTPFIRGNANNQGGVDLSDGVAVFGDLFLGSPATAPCRDALDANDSGGIDISDGIYILNFLFLGGDDIPAPFPNAGLDPTEDTLPGC